MANYISHMTSPHPASVPTTQYLSVPGGRLAHDVQGEGPLVLLVPGLGDLRSAYRFTTPALVEAGYTVATTDLRGHGESDATFDAYGDVATAGDLTALLLALGEPAVVVGSSMAAGAAVIVAAQSPDLVAALVLIGPFVRPPVGSALKVGLQGAALRVMMARPWAAAAWKAYLPTLSSGVRPVDFDQHRDAQIRAIKRPGYARAFSRTIVTDHVLAGQSLAAVGAPTLVVMGEKDPDFPDPRAEADWIAAALSGRAVMVPDAAHYPHAQQPGATAAALVDFLATVAPDACGDRA